MQMLTMERLKSLGTAVTEVSGHSTPFGVIIGNFYFFSGETPVHLHNFFFCVYLFLLTHRNSLYSMGIKPLSDMSLTNTFFSILWVFF